MHKVLIAEAAVSSGDGTAAFLSLQKHRLKTTQLCPQKITGTFGRGRRLMIKISNIFIFGASRGLRNMYIFDRQGHDISFYQRWTDIFWGLVGFAGGIVLLFFLFS